MKFSLSGLSAWARQVTTALGATGVSGTLGLYLTHQISGTAALVAVLPALVLVLWPEAKKAQVTAVVQAVVPPAEIAMKDVAAQILAKHVDLVTDIKDVVALSTALQSVLPLRAAVPAAQAAPAAA
jgi:hypothetical protein